MRVKLLYTLSVLVLFVRSAYAIYVPIQFSSGLNQDIIANGTGNASASTTVDMDDVSYDLVCQNFLATSTSTPLTFGLPVSGLVSSAATTGLNYQFSPFSTPYTGNNTMRVLSGANGVLTFQTPIAGQTLYILLTSTYTANLTGTITFSDNTTQALTSTAIPNWFSGTAPPIAVQNIGRILRTTNVTETNTTGPRLYEVSVPILTANQSKTIASVTINNTSTVTNSKLFIFAMTINQLVTCAAPTVPTATGITTTSAVLNWTQAGTPIGYQIKYGAPGFNVNTGGTSIFTTTKPYTLNPPLSIATSYSFYVRAICSSTDTSAWSPVTTFTTFCNAPSILSKKDSFNCGTGSVNLEATTTPGASIKWYAALTGGTALATGGTYATPSITATTTYYITAIAGTCESSPRQPVIATIRPIPSVAIGNDTTICPGASYTFNAGNAGAAYLWSPGGQTTQAITTNAAGPYSVKVTVNSCSNSDTILIIPGIVPANNLPAITNVCSGDTATLNAGNAGSTYVWSPGGAITQKIKTTTGGNYTVQIKSSNGCVATTGTNVFIRPRPFANLINDTSICKGATIMLDAGNTGNAFAWNTGSVTQAINVTDSGKYTVIVTTPYNCTMTDSVYIAYLPAPQIEGFNFIPEFFDELGKVSFSPLSPTHVDSYEWDFGDNSPHLTTMNPVHVYSASGSYTVSLTVSNSCSSYTLSQEINVDLPTGIVTINKNIAGLSVYPNPVKTVMNISIKNPDYKMKDVMLFNAIGAMVYHQKADSDNIHQLSVTGFANGNYFVRVLTDKGFINLRTQVQK